MNTMHPLNHYFGGTDQPGATLRAGPRGSAGTTDLIDTLLRRTARLLNDSVEAVRRLDTHTEETERQIEASRAFLADSYHTLDVLRRDRQNRG